MMSCEGKEELMIANPMQGRRSDWRLIQLQEQGMQMLFLRALLLGPRLIAWVRQKRGRARHRQRRLNCCCKLDQGATRLNIR